jgi:hypothetical protein
MATGLFRIENGWGTEHSVWVRYADGKELEIPESQYRADGYQPPFEDLTWGTKETFHA